MARQLPRPLGGTAGRTTHGDRPCQAGRREEQVTTESILGALRPVDADKGAVRVQDLYATDIDDLWSALTEPERLARWIAQVEGDLSLGGEFTARFTSSWGGPGRVDVCEPPRRLLLTM